MFYVGQTRNLWKRAYDHQARLRQETHGNAKLRNAYRKYGNEAFSFEVLYLVEDLSDLTRCEQFYVDWHPRGALYNIRIECVDSNRGRVASEETRRKISLAQIGRKRSPESVARSVAGNRGRKMSEEQRLALVAANLGRKASEETRRKLRESHLGKTASEETRRKMSEKSRGRKMSEEARRKLSASATGRKWSPEMRKKLSEAHKGKLWTDDAKAKLRETREIRNSPEVQEIVHLRWLNRRREVDEFEQHLLRTYFRGTPPAYPFATA